MCTFCTCLQDSLIRDRIVLCIRDAHTRKRLLQQTKLSLQKCIDICRSHEASNLQIKSMGEKTRVDDVHKVKMNKPKNKDGRNKSKHVERTTRKYDSIIHHTKPAVTVEENSNLAVSNAQRGEKPAKFVERESFSPRNKTEQEKYHPPRNRGGLKRLGLHWQRDSQTGNDLRRETTPTERDLCKNANQRKTRKISCGLRSNCERLASRIRGWITKLNQQTEFYKCGTKPKCDLKGCVAWHYEIPRTRRNTRWNSWLLKRIQHHYRSQSDTAIQACTICSKAKVKSWATKTDRPQCTRACCWAKRLDKQHGCRNQTVRRPTNVSWY